MSGIYLETNFPIAFDSPDHLAPWGTSRDNSKNFRFNTKIMQLFSYLDRMPKVLDLGCSGGGFVKSCLDDGFFSIGIEGSDFSKKHKRAEWPLLGDHCLFTGDITRPFKIKKNEVLLTFDLITAWEVMEHLPEDRLECTCQNLFSSVEEHGLIILSISPNEEIIHGRRLHQTVREKNWWIDLFKQHALINLPEYEAFFNTQYIRGPKQNAQGSFHVFLSKNPKKAPQIPKVSFKGKLFDRWHMSKPQKLLQKLVGMA